MRLLVLVWVGVFLSACADFADVLGARPLASSGYAVRPENSMRLDRRVDLRTSKEVSPAVSDDDGEITTEAALSQKGKGADFIWPVEGGVLTSRFGIRKGRSHDGIDISARRGTPVKASADGKVVYSGRLAGYGNLIVLKHDGNLFTAYAHAEKNRVKKGDKVRQGEVIATVGRTGHATGPHCHFEIRQKTEARNPLYFLPKTDAYAGN